MASSISESVSETGINQALFQFATMGIVVVQNGVIKAANPFAMTEFGYSESELEGKNIEILIPERFHQRHIHHREAFTRNPKTRAMGTGLNLFGVRKDGTEFPVEISLGNYALGEERFTIAFISNITVRKKNEDEIIKLNDELEAAVQQRTKELTETLHELERSKEELTRSLEKEIELSELKSRFVSMASHEFRTPLSTILSSAYLVEKYKETSEQPRREKHLGRIISSVNMLTDTLNDFLSVGKIEEGRIQVRFSEFGLNKITDTVVQELQTSSKPGQVIHYHHEGPELVYMDVSLFKHIVMNLVSNAIKFSPENKGINVSTKVTNNQVTLQVKDQGIGILLEDQQHLMGRFFRGANAINIQGTGLGLHIVAKYAELMNGHVICESEPGNGALFSVIFETEKNNPYENIAAD
jgi:PAS domain S-box-containing protein